MGVFASSGSLRWRVEKVINEKEKVKKATSCGRQLHRFGLNGCSVINNNEAVAQSVAYCDGSDSFLSAASRHVLNEP